MVSKISAFIFGFLGAACAISICYAVLKSTSKTQLPDSQPTVSYSSLLRNASSVKLERLGNSVANCLKRQNNKTNLWRILVQEVTNCVNNYSKIRRSHLTTLKMGRYHEKKRFLIPKNFANSTSECRWLTIGIGGDAKVEKIFHGRFPRCKLFGIEPSRDQFGNFEEYGKIIPMAVGLKSGKLKMNIRTTNGSYKKESVEIHPLPEVLDKYVGSRVIEFATLDIEGFEYDILNGLLQPNGVLAKAGVIFCQLDVELHNPKWKAKSFDFDSFFRRFLRNTNYIPIFAEKFLKIHHKMILVYTGRDSSCSKTFDLAKMFSK